MKFFLPDGREVLIPKTHGLWLWIELNDGQCFDALYRSLDILMFSLPMIVERFPLDQPGNKFELRVDELKKISVLQAIGARCKKSLDKKFGARR